MAFYRIPLTAGVEHVQYISGSLILVDGVDGAAGVDVTPILNNSPQVTMPARKAGFKYRTSYDAVALCAEADCEVSIFLTTNDVSLGFTDGAQVMVAGGVSIINAEDQRVPVDLAGGTVTVNAENVGINNDESHPIPVKTASLSNFTHKPVVSVGVGLAIQLVADPAFKRLHIRNGHASASIAIGGADVTLENAAIILGPGDMWTDDGAAGAAWYATSDTAATPVRVMGMK